MIRTLLALRLRATFASFKGRSKDGKPAKLSAGKIVLVSILMLYLGVTFIGLFTLMAVSMGMFYIPAGDYAMYFGLFMLIGFSMVFIFSIFETKAELFDCKDNELLLSMPISPGNIMLSRIATVLVYNYIEMALVMLPAIVVYGFMGGSPVGIIGGALAFLLLPLLATSLASALGYAVAAIVKRIKHKTLITTVTSVFFLVVYFIFYFGIMENAGMEEEEMVTSYPHIPFIAFIGKAATLSPLHTAVLAILCIGAAAIAYKLISGKYISIITSHGTTARREYKRSRLERRGAIYALTVKELRRFFSSSVYMLNSSMGVIFSIILAVATVVKIGEITPMLSELGLSRDAIYPVLVSALCICASLNMPSAAAVSMEGKSFWIPKSMPITSRQILLSKLLSHIIVTVTPTVLASIILIVGTGAYGIDLPFMIVIPTLTSLLFGILGLVLNTAFPKLEYDNEAQPVKQSLPIFLIMIISMVWDVIMIGIAIASVLLGMSVIGYIVSILLHIAMCAAFMAILLGPSAKKLEKI